MAVTISGTNGIVGAGFTVDNSGVSVTAGVGTFSSVRGTHHGDGANLTSIPAANIVGVATAGFERTGGFPSGVTEIDQWWLTTDFTGATDPIQNNLSRYTTGGYLGTGMSVSSGIWTFPSTGFWRIDVNGQVARQSGHQSRYQQIRIMLSTDSGSNYSVSAIADAGYFDNYDSGQNRINGCHASVFFDVTNVSTHKVKFLTTVEDNSGTGVVFSGNATIPTTLFQFTRLGDT